MATVTVTAVTVSTMAVSLVARMTFMALVARMTFMALVAGMTVAGMTVATMPMPLMALMTVARMPFVAMMAVIVVAGVTVMSLGVVPLVSFCFVAVAITRISGRTRGGKCRSTNDQHTCYQNDQFFLHTVSPSLVYFATKGRDELHGFFELP